jgi:formylglycine-generating enzyme required for sulfatase activity
MLAIMVAVLLIPSCQKELPDAIKNIDVSQGDKTSSSTSKEKYMRVSVESLSFTSPEGSMSFTITSNTSWTIKSDHEWCTVSSTSGSNDATLTVNVSENTSTSSRSATITISTNDAGSVKVRVHQAGADSNLQLNKANLSFTATGGSDSFTITSNTNWTITSDQTWCTVSTSSGSENGTITVNVSENKSTESRSATITVRAGTTQQAIAVTQAGAKVQDTRQKLNLRFIESSIVMHSDESVSVSFTHDGDLSKLDDSLFKCSVDDEYPGGVYLTEGYVHVMVGEALATVNIELSFAGNDYYLPERISIMVTYIPPVNENTRTFTVNGVSFKMIRVDGGTFTMGATSEQGDDAGDCEKPAHQVTLSSYYIGETEVTQELWLAVMGSNPSYFSGSKKPVERVTWNDCQDFITKLNGLTGQNFRLPTEAEWEFAARGGNKSRGYKYAGSNTIDNVAWYCDNSDFETHNVAAKSANELGLYDMSGNVWEWCQDWYGSYSSSSQTNPTGPNSGNGRVFRNGGFDFLAVGCRVSYREPIPAYPYYGWDGGLRLALQ